MGKIVLLNLALAFCLFMSKASAEDDWYEFGHFYQIYPRSFQDSDGDGVGDLNGITLRMNHLKYIGIDGVWLSPIFQSPLKDFGYDISDFQQIHSEYGTMDDFDRLIERCKELDVKLILDFVPNHSSDQHKWFNASSDPQHPEHEKYKDYYVWNKGKLQHNGTRAPPSNWISVFGGSAWTWVEARQEYYYHQFLPAQPDLNFRNKQVAEEMNEILRFWLRKGVAGFRVDAIPHLFESKENSNGVYDDEPLTGWCQPHEYCYLDHIHTHDVEDTFPLVYDWRSVIDEAEFVNTTRILMAEAYSPLHTALRYYGKTNENNEIVEYGCQMPFNFELMSNTWAGTNSHGYIENIRKWIDNLPKGKGIHANWVLGNHDSGRLASRYRPARTDIFNILLNTLPGISVTYYGEEIGMTNVPTPSGDGREPSRTPMQWDSTKNAGFSSGETTWLPLAENYTTNNVELQKSQKRSYLKNFRLLATLRQNPTLKYGTLQLVAVDNDVLAYKREINDRTDADIIVVVLNLEGWDKKIDLNHHFQNLPKTMKAAIVSIHAETITPGQIVETNKVVVPGEVGVVLVGRNA